MTNAQDNYFTHAEICPEGAVVEAEPLSQSAKIYSIIIF